MGIFPYCLTAALLLVFSLSRVHGHSGHEPFWSSDEETSSSDDSGGKSPRPEFEPRSIDEVLMRASRGRTPTTRAMTTDVLDGLDMMLTQHQFSSLYSGVRTRSGGHTIARPWTNGIIPYEIKESDFDSEKLAWIHQAMKNWEHVTCVQFRPATPSDTNKIQIHTGDGCWANLGMKGGTQEVNLDPDCFWRGTIEHELGHALGMIHEHQRQQRDGYIKVDYYAVQRTFIDAVTKYARGSDDKMGLDYDYDSIMHYGKNAFSSNGYSQTFYPRDPAVTDVLGMTLKPTFLDAKLINLMYKCGDRCTNGHTCPSDCFLTAQCDCKCKDDFKEPCQDTDPVCPQRAKDGDCNENTIFMHTKCRLSCGICNNQGEEPHLICTNSDSRCQQWADSGECDNNPNYMHRSCPLACGDCRPGDKYAHEGPCRDRKGECHELAAKGECDRNPKSMLKDCTKSCDFCPEDVGKDPSDRPGCVDYDTVCQFRAANGLCHKYYALMSSDCPVACGNCNGSIVIPPSCVDSDKQCTGWAYSGECDTNPNYMLTSCQRSCSTCPGLNRPDKCMDYDVLCPGWAASGECDFNPVWMSNNCKKSCSICTEDGSIPPARVCKDWDTRCAGWASQGECDANPYWMHGHCKLSCNKCQGQNGGSATTSSPGGTTRRTTHTDGDCVDSNANCPGWAAYGECTKNPGYMLEGCKKSCNVCNGQHQTTRTSTTEGGDCVDSHESCADWASSGQCEANPGYMLTNCRKSCHECGPGGYHHTTVFIPGCHDDNGNCVEWAKFQQCQKNPGYMHVHCKKSCGQCS